MMLRPPALSMELISLGGGGLIAVLWVGAVGTVQPMEISTRFLLLPENCEQQNKHGIMRALCPTDSPGCFHKRKSKAYREG